MGTDETEPVEQVDGGFGGAIGGGFMKVKSSPFMKGPGEADSEEGMEGD